MHQTRINIMANLTMLFINNWLPLWSSGLSSWLQIRRSGFDSRRYQIFWEVVGLEWSPLSLLSTIEELLERKSIGFDLGNRDYGCKGSALLITRQPSIRKKLALTSPTIGGCSVSIVRSWTRVTEFVCLFINYRDYMTLITGRCIYTHLFTGQL
jgi:hypothetical protein